MKAILYVSKATREFSSADLSELLHQCERRNLGLGITGYLYFQAPHFFQYIESEGDEVDQLMQSISADDRHRILHTLEDTFTGIRRFAGWSMSFVKREILSLEELVLDDLLSLDRVYKDKAMWRDTLFNLMRTIAQNRNNLEY